MLLSLSFSAIFLTGSGPGPDPAHDNTLVVHEWGTFTAVAGQDGEAELWSPLSGPSDLPSFVHLRPGIPDTRQTPGSQSGNRRFVENSTGKGGRSIVRMETPVLYFYTPVETEVEVKVGFPGGQITEWYPRVSSLMGEDGINWGRVKLLPNNTEPLPQEDAPSHYYPARAVNSATVKSCSQFGNEHERFLFYRGVGNFQLSLQVRLENNTLHLSSDRPLPGPALVFERQGNKVGVVEARVGQPLDRPVLDDSLEDVTNALSLQLRATGLYEDEVQAMLNTWKDQWFEDGLRVFYLLPSEEVGERLPLQVSPAPDELVRTLVGRVEIITPEMERSVRRELLPVQDQASAQQVLDNLRVTQGRFAEPILRRLSPESTAAQRVLALGWPDSGQEPPVRVR